MPGDGALAAASVAPGERVGWFVLGMGVNDAIELLRKGFAPRRPRVDVVYSASEPLQREIVLRVEELGLQLRFEGASQKLRMVDVFDLAKIGLVYDGYEFGLGRARRASFLGLYKAFGPTYPGSFDPALERYVLRYNGVCFMFPLPKKHWDRFTEANELPLELDGESPVACRMMVYNGLDERNPQLANFPDLAAAKALRHAAPVPLPTVSPSYLEEVCFKLCPGAPTSISFLWRYRTLRIGSSVQDILSELGQPSRIYFKQDNRMRIHKLGGSAQGPPAAASTAAHVAAKGEAAADAPGAGGVAGPPVDPLVERDPTGCFQRSDYFYNYFHLGLDLLIDVRQHRLRKVIVHSNLPGHSDFSQYNKCEFRLVFERPSPESSSGRGEGGAGNCAIITPGMRWPEVEALLGPCGRPMIHDSGVSTNPFGATYLYAYEGCVFEVMRSGHLAAVTLF